MKNSLLTAALATASCSMALAAGSITEAISFGPQLSDNTVYTFTAPQYNPTNGPLTSIVISVDAFTEGGLIEYTVTNTTPGNLSLSLGTTIQITGPASLTLTPNPTNSETFIGVTDLSAGNPFSITADGGLDSDSQTLTDAADFVPYTGFGNVTFSIIGDLVQLSGGTNITGTGDATANTYAVEGTITYNFVPEPSSTALIGLAGFGLLIRRRK